MRRIHFLAGIGLLLSPALAGASPGPSDLSISFDCYAEHEGTNIHARTEGGFVNLSVIHGGGADRIPIVTEPLYPPELSWLERLTALAKQLGPSYQLVFDLNECRKTAPDQMNCLNRNSYNLDGLTVNHSVFYTSETVKNALGMSFKGHAVYLSMELNSMGYRIEINYSEGGCRFRE